MFLSNEEEILAALRDGVEGVLMPREDGREVWQHPETGQVHRLGGPALTTPDEASWCVAGLRHREDGPAEVRSTFERWWRYGTVHRVAGPAVVFVSGVRFWMVNGHEVVGSDDDQDALEDLYDEGRIGELEQVLTMWDLGGPSAAELCAAVLAAHA